MFKNVVLALSTFSMVACGGGGSDTNSVIDAIDQSNELLTDQSSNGTPINQVGDVWVPEYCSRPPVSELGGEWAGTITLVANSEPLCEYDTVLRISGSSASGSTCDMSGTLRFMSVRTSPNVNPPLSCEVSAGDAVEIGITQTSLLESILQGAFTIVPEGTFITADIGYPLRFTANANDAPAGDNDINSAPVPYSGLALQLNQDGTITFDDEGILFEAELIKVE